MAARYLGIYIYRSVALTDSGIHCKVRQTSLYFAHAQCVDERVAEAVEKHQEIEDLGGDVQAHVKVQRAHVSQ